MSTPEAAAHGRPAGHPGRPQPGVRPPRRRALAAGAVLALTLAALSGCAQGGKEPAGGAQRANPSAVAPAGAAQSTAPPLPDSRLTPATGSFTKEEKKYLSGRVPVNTDPAAVLQLGQEACQRVARTARHDREAAVGAVITGDIPGAEDAIAQLCPDQLPVLRAARAGFPDGDTKRPAAGTYRALGQGASSCARRAVGAGGRVLASGATMGKGSGSGPGGKAARVTAKVPAGTRQFVSSGCYAWVPA
jgi:hypothetical protein